MQFFLEFTKQFDVLRGSSSLLFCISFYQAFTVSKLLFWKISNGYLIFASFLCNASNNPQFLLLDYLAIFCVCSSYINSSYLNQFLTNLCFLEFGAYETIDNAKNITYIIAMCKSIYQTNLYCPPIYTILLFANYLLATATYLYRRHLYYEVPLYYKQIDNTTSYSNIPYYYYIFLTWIIHLNITLAMSISSITAV